MHFSAHRRHIQQKLLTKSSTSAELPVFHKQMLYNCYLYLQANVRTLSWNKLPYFIHHSSPFFIFIISIDAIVLAIVISPLWKQELHRGFKISLRAVNTVFEHGLWTTKRVLFELLYKSRCLFWTSRSKSWLSKPKCSENCLIIMRKA